METVLSVVIADSSEAFASALQEALEQTGTFSVAGVSANGEEVLRLLESTKADILVMDPMLTGWMALEFCAALRQSVSHRLLWW